MRYDGKKKIKCRRAHCSMCKSWKDGYVARGSIDFEKYSDFKRRKHADNEVKEAKGKHTGD